MAGTRPLTKGPAMEETLRAYFWRAGYFVVRGLPYRIDGEDVTDIDLWLYERPAATTRRRFIVDVKNKRSPKATERVIWAAGLRQALQVDAAIVATTDRRPSTRRLARSLGINVLDGEAIHKLSQSSKLKSDDVLTSEEWDGALKSVDSARGSNSWRDTVRSVRSMLISDFGVRSANTALSAVRVFAVAATEAQPQSATAITALRALYASAASAAISLDYSISEYAFGSIEDRIRAVSNGIRYGQAEDLDALRAVRLATGLARDFAENGKAVARQIEAGFLEAADKISAEIVAEYVARQASNDGLFIAARLLESAALARSPVGFDDLQSEAKSALAVFLDFAGVQRDAVAGALSISRSSENGAVRSSGPLFSA